MKTVGEVFRKARVKRKLSVGQVEADTKIKAEFIRAIEGSRWHLLPEFPVVVGFVKSLGDYYEVGREQATALLRRDYPPKSVNVNPKPDVSKQFVWSPRLTFMSIAALVFLVFFVYLFAQIRAFNSPPPLGVLEPKEGARIESMQVHVAGVTNSSASVTVNNQPALVDEDGNFAAEVEVTFGEQELVIKAVSRSGKETEIRRKINVVTENKH